MKEKGFIDPVTHQTFLETSKRKRHTRDIYSWQTLCLHGAQKVGHCEGSGMRESHTQPLPRPCPAPYTGTGLKQGDLSVLINAL